MARRSTCMAARSGTARASPLKKHASIDVREMPAGSAPKADSWTTDTFLKAGRPATKAACRSARAWWTSDPSTPSARSSWPLAPKCDIKGNVVVKNDNVRAALEYYKNSWPSCDRAGMGRRFQQQMADSGGRTDRVRPARGRPPHATLISLRNAGPTASRRVRKAASHRTCLITGRCGISQEQGGGQSLITHMSQPAAMRNWWRRATVMTCRRREPHHPQDMG
jgi:hypothetical protein